MTKFIMVSILLFFTSNVISSSNNEFSEEIDSLYNFAPHKLSKGEIEQKSGLLDVFWKKVRKNPARYKPLLRNELNTNNHTPFFFYDASMLLLSISDNKKDKLLVLRSIQKTDLDDIKNTDYLLTVFRLSVEGFDTSDAALHVLESPDFKAFIVQHSLTLGQDYSFISMLMPVNESKYINKAIKRITTETNEVAIKSLIKLFWYADTPEALKAIANIANNNKYSTRLRKLSNDILSEDMLKQDIAKEKLEKLYDELQIDEDRSYSDLKELRKKRFNRVSDEALIELDQITFLMKRKRILN